MAVVATFARMYVTELDRTLEALGACGLPGVRLRFGHSAGLQLALVGDVLVLAGSDEALEPFRSTALTVVVDDLEQAIGTAQAGGATISRAPADQTVGRNVTLSFPQGLAIEFVQWNQETRSAAGLENDSQ